ncbi:hypothetical protein JG687_00018113 [Phytophthora cactorum]|uniref:Uncharacterized protein n=1 Tax=Phytophthora cactorum TaxID=29920 RepID=A0A8T1TNL7_9STRA|nr:hypothetical protein JG687_00018113 [Phytophthora cactorum]
MRGGKHRCISSHCMAFDATPSPPACLLPRSVDGVSSYRVVLAGTMAERQDAQVRKMHLICYPVVKRLLKFCTGE